MKTYLFRLLSVLLCFAALAAAVNVFGIRLSRNENSQRNVVIQRIQAELQAQWTARETNDTPSAFLAEQIEDAVFYSHMETWSELYGQKHCPESVTLFLTDDTAGDADKGRNGGSSLQLGGQNTVIRAFYSQGKQIGFVEYRFSDTVYGQMLLLTNLCLAFAALLVMAYSVWIMKKILIPFQRISDYPERLSKGELTEKLPESKDKYFGKYLWGMNMLSDKMEHDRQTIRRITLEQKKLVTVLVHGIKTPAANIKLLSEAIETGLYDPDGKIHSKDAELAGKIEKNADEIEQLVSKAVDTANSVLFDFNPDAEPFYRSRLEQFVQEEYKNRLNVGRIPFRVESDGNPMINSDLEGICRILRQFMDNAIKYGDGTEICLKLEKNDEGHFISVINRGEPLPKEEIPYVFNSLWRGSNSVGINGSGIGLYEARYIASKLGGDVYMRTGENMTAVTLYLPF